MSRRKPNLIFDYCTQYWKKTECFIRCDQVTICMQLDNKVDYVIAEKVCVCNYISTEKMRSKMMSAYENADIYILWLREHFLPRKGLGKALLIVDGNTYCSAEVLELAESYDYTTDSQKLSNSCAVEEEMLKCCNDLYITRKYGEGEFIERG
ncbi:hypothetical protein HHI36_007083, partial [Cryptolaemus montrouzieri]